MTYRRTFIGPFWQSAQLILWAIGLGYVFKPFHQGEIEYIPYLVAGLAVWNFLSAVVTTGASVFVANAGIILNTPTKPSYHIVRSWTNLFLRFLFQIIVFAPVAVYYDMLTDIKLGAALAGVVYLAALAVPVIVVAGVANTYMRDVEHMIAVVMRFFFFLTPVFWIPVEGQVQTAFVRFNPFFYPLELVRQPLLGAYPEGEIVVVAVAMLLVAMVVAWFLLNATKNKLAVWL